MPRDLLYLPGENETLVLATDCSSSIGMKQLDVVKSPYQVTSYYLTRVVLMELISVGATPVAYTLNSSFQDHWEELRSGIEKAFREINLEAPPHIGSSEKNFPTKQTSVGITIMGKVKGPAQMQDYDHYAIIGKPLVGAELLEQEAQAVSLKECLDLRHDFLIGEMLPVGSRGIQAEFETHFGKKLAPCDLDLDKSAGPSSCLIISYSPGYRTKLAKQFGDRICFLKIAD